MLETINYQSTMKHNFHIGQDNNMDRCDWTILQKFYSCDVARNKVDVRKLNEPFFLHAVKKTSTATSTFFPAAHFVSRIRHSARKFIVLFLIAWKQNLRCWGFCRVKGSITFQKLRIWRQYSGKLTGDVGTDSATVMVGVHWLQCRTKAEA